MKKELITICDLTHTATNTYATNLMPYPIASIKSNVLEFSKYKENLEIEIFKHPQEFISAFLSKSPKLELISSAIFPSGELLFPPGAIIFQNSEWLEWPPPPFLTAPLIDSGTSSKLIRSSTTL